MVVVDADLVDGTAEAVAVEAFPQAPGGVGAGRGAFDGAAAVAACGTACGRLLTFSSHLEITVVVPELDLLVQHAATSSLAAVLH